MDSGLDFSWKDEHGPRQKSPRWPLFPPSVRGEETQKSPAKRTETQIFRANHRITHWEPSPDERLGQAGGEQFPLEDKFLGQVVVEREEQLAL